MSRALKCERYDRLATLIGFAFSGIENHIREDIVDEEAIIDALVVIQELLYEASKIPE